MDNSNSNAEHWDWQGDGCYLQKDNQLDISSFLWDHGGTKEDDLSYMFEDATPIKSCMGFDYNEKMEKIQKEEVRDSSQLKRRRMLQFSTDDIDPFICNEKMPFAFVRLKDRENSLVDEERLEHLQWPSALSDAGTLVHECLDQSSERWLENCFNENDTNFTHDNMNYCGSPDNTIDISEVCNMQSEMEIVPAQTTPSMTLQPLCIPFKGRKSYMQTPTKMSSSIAYPFTLIKPCSGQGDVTLNDINQLIRTPSSLKNKKVESSPSFLKSAITGKPVVVKTKIQTEGGKGSITIMRTKG